MDQHQRSTLQTALPEPLEPELPVLDDVVVTVPDVPVEPDEEFVLPLLEEAPVLLEELRDCPEDPVELEFVPLLAVVPDDDAVELVLPLLELEVELVVTPEPPELEVVVDSEPEELVFTPVLLEVVAVEVVPLLEPLGGCPLPQAPSTHAAKITQLRLS